MFRTKVTETSTLAGFAPAGKPANRRERFCSTRNSARRIVSALGKLDGGKRACFVFVVCAATAVALPAQTFTTLFSFDGTNGENPYAGLVQGNDGNLYGTTDGGGTGANCPYASGCGTVFKITPSGTLTTLHSFCSQSGCADGEFLQSGLIQAANGDLYGTTQAGGASGGGGTVFKITPAGALTTLYSFCSAFCPDGSDPLDTLVQASNGDFYGTTLNGGPANWGTVFKITPGGTLTTLYDFCPQGAPCADGGAPASALVQATNGDLYGTTEEAGTGGYGTIFKITPSGELTTLHSFDGSDGYQSGTALVQATNGDFYGTTNSAENAHGHGVVFRISPTGAFTKLYSFCSQSNCTDGSTPFAGLIQATDGNFYGTTADGGANGYGTIFRITPSGTLTTLYSFCSQSGCTDGKYPFAALVQATNGNLYGTTVNGGTSTACYAGSACGTIFSLSVGLGPFVKTQTTSGKVGAAVKILGTGLTGTTSVSFNGTAAVFTVVSPSLIKTTVPAGATTGKVEVVTPSGTLSSNVPFRVR